MTQIEKAHAWLQSKGYASHMFETDLYVTLWNNALDEPTDIHVSTAEIEYRADLWDSQQDTNQTQLPL
jgi:hypothetical protein